MTRCSSPVRPTAAAPRITCHPVVTVTRRSCELVETRTRPIRPTEWLGVWPAWSGYARTVDDLALGALVGLVAGLFDAAPMQLRGLDRRDVASAFVQWFFLSIVIVAFDLPHVVWWLEGAVVAVALSLPIAILVSKTDAKSVPVILGTSAVLGTLVGVAGHLLGAG